MKKISKDNKFIIIYILTGLVLSLLSLFLLFINIYEVSVCLSISYFFNIFTFLIMLKSNKKLDRNGNFKLGQFTSLSILRFCLIALSVLIPALILKFSGDSNNNFRFLYILICLISFINVVGLYSLRGYDD